MFFGNNQIREEIAQSKLPCKTKIVTSESENEIYFVKR